MIIALKVGGSVLCPGESPDMGFVAKLAAVLNVLSGKHRLVVVAGGGGPARKMIEEARACGETSDDVLHNMGIEAARKNAAVLVESLGRHAFAGVPRTLGEVKKAFKSGKIVVLGGFRPGQTTDAVTLQCAEAIGADIAVIGTDVKGVYDRDPKKHSDAKFISMISASELMEMVETESVSPGAKTIIDPVAVDVAGRTGIRTVVLDIRNLENLKNAIKGSDFEGTIVG